MAPGNLSTNTKDFSIKEFECLRKEVEMLLTDTRTLERNTVIAVGITWGWLLEKSQTLHLPKFAWFFPCLFAVLGLLRHFGFARQFSVLHEYIETIEELYYLKEDPCGWEHFIGPKRHWHAASTNLFWTLTIAATFYVAFYETL